MGSTTKTGPIDAGPGVRLRLSAVRSRHSGATLIVLMTLIVLTSASVLLDKLNSRARAELEQQVRTAEALSAAKAALLAYAVTYPDNYGDTRGPGYLPCPDTNNNGLPNPDCGPKAIGRLPDSIKTDVDGIPGEEEIFAASDLRDGAGERLWYALSDDFREDPPADPAVVNSDTFGQLTLDVAPALEDKVVALIFAPGIEVGSQYRDGSENDVTQYLESENSDGDESFVSADMSVDFNDRVVAVTRDELMTAVEKRVMAEVSQALEDYKEDYGSDVSYPWLSPFGDPKIDELTGSAGVGSGGTTLSNSSAGFIKLGVRVGDVVRTWTPPDEDIDSLGIIDAVNPTTVTVTGLNGANGNSFAVGDSYRISRFNGVIDATEGLVPFHAVDEPFKTDYVVDWNMAGANGISVTASGGLAAYQTALENFVESSAWSGSVPVAIEDGICVWTINTSAGVKCTGFFDMTFFEGSATKNHANELEDSTLHFDEWGVVSGAETAECDRRF